MLTSDVQLNLSAFCEYEVYYPATPNMRPFGSAVVQDVFVVAAGILKGIGEDWEAVKGTVDVDAFGEAENSGGEPRGVNDDGAEGERAKDISNELALCISLCLGPRGKIYVYSNK